MSHTASSSVQKATSVNKLTSLDFGATCKKIVPLFAKKRVTNST